MKDADDPVLLANRKKFGRTGPRRRLPAEESPTASPRCKKPRSSDVADEEIESLTNDKSSAEHKAFILSESSSSNPAKGELLKSMKATFKSRRSDIEACMPTAEILMEYPLLRESYWLLEEMKIMNNGLNILDNIQEKAIFSQHPTKINWNHVPTSITAVMDSVKMNWMVGIPAMFKESYDKFLVIDQDDSESPNPIIHLDTGKKTWTVHFDGLKINDIVDFAYALAIILALHWVFNIQFERSVNNTLHFLSICIGKIKGLRVPSAVTSICDKM